MTVVMLGAGAGEGGKDAGRKGGWRGSLGNSLTHYLPECHYSLEAVPREHLRPRKGF